MIYNTNHQPLIFLSQRHFPNSIIFIILIKNIYFFLTKSIIQNVWDVDRIKSQRTQNLINAGKQELIFHFILPGILFIIIQREIALSIQNRHFFSKDIGMVLNLRLKWVNYFQSLWQNECLRQIHKQLQFVNIYKLQMNLFGQMHLMSEKINKHILCQQVEFKFKVKAQSRPQPLPTSTPTQPTSTPSSTLRMPAMPSFPRALNVLPEPTTSCIWWAKLMAGSSPQPSTFPSKENPILSRSVKAMETSYTVMEPPSRSIIKTIIIIITITDDPSLIHHPKLHITQINIKNVLISSFSNINLLMNNPEEYIHNSLNSSVSKIAHAFPKADRFDKSKKLPTEVKYTLPSMSDKRSCSFGYGNKSSLVLDRCSPPPGSYQPRSMFSKEGKKAHSPTFGLSRDTILFGSYLTEARKKSEQLPSPSKYDIKLPKARIGGSIGIRIGTEPSAKSRHFPGPGTYNMDSIDMANSSLFSLSKFKKYGCPKYHQSKTIDVNNHKDNRSIKFYDIEDKQFGKCKLSRHRNVSIASFGKEKKMTTIDKWKLNVPGCKYNYFSEFGNNYK